MLYFSYGSNMATSRLERRAPSARTVGVARLPGHRLRFHKRGQDASGKCDVEWTADDGDVVFGVVFEITEEDKVELDKHEGLHAGYEEKIVSIHLAGGAELRAVTYYATAIDRKLKPFAWYREHVVRGALEHGLPAQYVRTLLAVETVADPDPSRHARELSVYGRVRTDV
ncbi:MAG: gamma-glutamylcyclotransferase [Acidobacteria bacterium]|nr:MAG: gamma-glutamylcyclotransferase [Acidobacteriota bacterium]